MLNTVKTPQGGFAMFDCETADRLLIEATKKLLWLRQQDRWSKERELPRRWPPILWFGNARSPKRKVLTIGANPSRWEYLDGSCRRDLNRYKESGDESLLCYLDKPMFRVLDAAGESLEGILANRTLRGEIVQGYNDYLSNNPYQLWFGHPKEDSYKVEGFLRGLGASFYGAETMPYQAIHIDLLPFATLSDFGKLRQMAATDLFDSGWARQAVASLVRLFQPLVIIVFGRTNACYLAKHVDASVSRLPWTKYPGAAYQIGSAEELGAEIVGLSVNLGNPKGFNSADLRGFGSHVGKLMGLDNNRL